MPRRQPTAQRLRTAARWPLGVGLTAWRYLWRLTPIERWDWSGSPEQDLGPALPDGVVDDDLQAAGDGVGPLLRRLYRVRIRASSLSPEQLVSLLARDLDAMAPSEFASFQKLSGEQGELRVGDEYVVRMPGPWDGPVRCVELDDNGFGLATLDGHLEAGRIHFGAHDLGPGRLEVRIEAWARGGDRFSNLLFDRLPVNKEVQLHMWTSVLERLIRLSGGTRDGRIDITTRRVDPAAFAHAA
jgi:hypothetical protein